MRQIAFTSTIVVATLFCAVPQVQSEDSIPALVKRAQPAIVTVIGYDESGEPAQLGTGFFIDRRGYLITNRHVIAGSSKAEIKTHSGRIYPVKRILAEDEEGDLVKVDIDIALRSVKTLKLAKKVPDPGQRVIVIGSPFGLEQTVSDGIVSTVREAESVGKVVQITAPISPGSSGSPVLNLDGTVLGVATVQFAAGQNLNFAIPSTRVMALKQVKAIAFAEWAATTYARAGLRAAAQGKWDESLANYINATKANPSLPQAYEGLGTALHALGQYDEAMTAYEQALRLDPKAADALFQTGELYAKREQWTEARERYRRSLELRPNHPHTLHSLGILYLALGDSEAARKEYEQLKSIDASLADDLLKRLEPVTAPEPPANEDVFQLDD